MKTMLVLTAVLTLSACSTYGMQCRGRLQPINRPTAVSDKAKGTPTESHP